MEPTFVLGEIAPACQSIAHDHVGFVVRDGPDKVQHAIARIGHVGVGKNVDVRVDAAEGAANCKSLALPRFGQEPPLGLDQLESLESSTSLPSVDLLSTTTIEASGRA